MAITRNSLVSAIESNRPGRSSGLLRLLATPAAARLEWTLLVVGGVLVAAVLGLMLWGSVAGSAAVS